MKWEQSSCDHCFGLKVRHIYLVWTHKSKKQNNIVNILTVHCVKWMPVSIRHQCSERANMLELDLEEHLSNRDHMNTTQVICCCACSTVRILVLGLMPNIHWWISCARLLLCKLFIETQTNYSRTKQCANGNTFCVFSTSLSLSFSILLDTWWPAFVFPTNSPHFHIHIDVLAHKYETVLLDVSQFRRKQKLYFRTLTRTMYSCAV